MEKYTKQSLKYLNMVGPCLDRRSLVVIVVLDVFPLCDGVLHLLLTGVARLAHLGLSPVSLRLPGLLVNMLRN